MVYFPSIIGATYSLGRVDYGRLGLGEDCKESHEPTCISSLKNEAIVSVACASSVSLALTKQGKKWFTYNVSAVPKWYFYRTIVQDIFKNYFSNTLKTLYSYNNHIWSSLAISIQYTIFDIMYQYSVPLNTWNVQYCTYQL